MSELMRRWEQMSEEATMSTRDTINMDGLVCEHGRTYADCDRPATVYGTRSGSPLCDEHAGEEAAMTIDIDNLSAEFIGVTPRDFDFAEGWTETWDRVLPDWTVLDTVQLIELAEDYGIEDRIVREFDITDEEYREVVIAELTDHANGSDTFWPMMNYAYRVNADVSDAAQLALASLPVTIVDLSGGYFGGDTYLALTGGGMDLSWEICHAYMVCGYLPPVHFAKDLPRMAFSYSEYGANLPVAKAALRSCEIAFDRAEENVERARGMLEWVREGA